MYTPNHILFPPDIIADLEDMRGDEWQALVRRVKTLPDNHIEKLGFVLMMVRLNGCLDCETDSYRAMRGCDLCASQTLRRYKGPDSDLLKLFQQSVADVGDYQPNHVSQFSNVEIIPILS